MDIRLGFEVGSGRPIDIPLKHMAITGQTQEAGKTTALEALIARGDIRALTFITKRGEGSFTGARRIDPYFREQADWQFVASILEASRGEKLKFERAWIIRASAGARTLADVQRNVQRAMEKAKGMSADVYLTLDAYLEVVVPQIASVHWAPTVRLGDGIHAMDLTHLSTEMQHLVIKSSLDWVLKHEQHTAVVIPEAWKFIPQGRGTPVKLAAEAFVRQAAALHNFLWLDSQDIAGVEKIILKSVPLWILGVQREANEIKRTLDNIPAGVAKPSKADIATLELGQFFACWGRHCIKTYVQPVWSSDAVARGVAMGNKPAARPVVKEKIVTTEEAEILRAENADLKQRIIQLENLLMLTKSPSLARLNVPVQPRANEPARSIAQIADEDLYQTIKARLMKEAPQLLKVLAIKPELEITRDRPTISMNTEKQPGLLASMIAEKYFDQPVSGPTIVAELKRRGRSVHHTNVYRDLNRLAEMGFLTIESSGFQAVKDMKVNIIS